jgi:hypothetical protein
VSSCPLATIPPGQKKVFDSVIEDSFDMTITSRPRSAALWRRRAPAMPEPMTRTSQ